nr:unnamed protein product [Timema douglasi]
MRVALLPFVSSHFARNAEQSDTCHHSTVSVTSLLLVVSDSDDEYEADEDTHEVGYASEPSTGILDDGSLLRRRAGGSLSLSENELE